MEENKGRSNWVDVLRRLVATPNVWLQLRAGTDFVPSASSREAQNKLNNAARRKGLQITTRCSKTEEGVIGAMFLGKRPDQPLSSGRVSVNSSSRPAARAGRVAAADNQG